VEEIIKNNIITVILRRQYST